MPAHARYWRLAEVLGLGDFPPETCIATSDADRTWAADQLRGLPHPLFAVHPGARWETKRWPVSKFAELMARAQKTWSGSVLLLGSKVERPDAEQLQRDVAARIEAGRSSQIVNLAGQSTLKQLSALLSQGGYRDQQRFGTVASCRRTRYANVGIIHMYICDAFRTGRRAT